MRKHFGATAFLIVLLFAFIRQCSADSSYVLPYPSSMPGNKFYKVHLFLEHLEKYWYFGNFGQFKYNLKQSNKYLVESKTLFDYKQYMLAYKAIQKSDLYFSKTYQYLEKANKEGKDIGQNLSLLKKASSKHIEVLEKIKTTVPDTFNWQEEKSLAVLLYLGKKISQSIDIRKRFL